MDVLSDIDFLRRDNANLLKEVQSLRLQSSLLRERNNDLERNIQEHLAGTKSHNRRASKSVTIDMTRETIPKLRLDTNVLSPTYDFFRLSLTPDIKLAESLEKQNPQGASWFDDSPVHAQAHPPPSMPPPPPPPSHSEPRRSNIIKISSMNGTHLHGSRFIGEAPRPTPERQTEEPPVDIQQMPTFTPPSPDPSERRAIPVPSLYSVPPPVTGVALPHVALSLLELKLIRKDTYDSPAAVASFMHKLTRKEHPPQATYRVAFTAAFLDLIPLLGPLPSEWIAFLHDFPSCIPATKRDSIVTLPWPESAVTVPTLSPQIKNAAVRSPTTLNTYQTRRRSRSLDDIRRQSYISVAGKGQSYVMHIQRTPASTGLPPCERDAWVLLLALAYTAYPASRVAKKLRQLPITVKLQIIAWLPPTVNVYDNMSFASNTVDEALGQLWDAKKEILRLKHGWP